MWEGGRGRGHSEPRFQDSLCVDFCIRTVILLNADLYMRNSYLLEEIRILDLVSNNLQNESVLSLFFSFGNGHRNVDSCKVSSLGDLVLTVF